MAAARRELDEEAGIEARNPRLIGTLDPLPGYIRSRAHVVMADVTFGPLATEDPDEIGSVFWASWTEIESMIRSGAIREVQAVSALLLASLMLR